MHSLRRSTLSALAAGALVFSLGVSACGDDGAGVRQIGEDDGGSGSGSGSASTPESESSSTP